MFSSCVDKMNPRAQEEEEEDAGGRSVVANEVSASLHVGDKMDTSSVPAENNEDDHLGTAIPLQLVITAFGYILNILSDESLQFLAQRLTIFFWNCFINLLLFFKFRIRGERKKGTKVYQTRVASRSVILSWSGPF